MVKNASRLAALWLALAAAPAMAFDEGVDAGLTIERAHTDLDSGAELRISRITLSLAEEFQPWLTLGLYGGPLLLTERNNPATSGVELGGYHIGIAATGEIFRDSPIGLRTTLSYSYLRADDDNEADREIAISLYEARGELAAVARLDPFELQLGAYALDFDGDQTISGTTNSSVDLEADEPFGGFAQAELRVDATGTVGIRLDAGARRSVALTFARSF